MDLHDNETEAKIPLDLDKLYEGVAQELLKLRYSRKTLRNFELVCNRLTDFIKTHNGGSNVYSSKLAEYFVQSFCVREGEQVKQGERWRHRIGHSIKILDYYVRTGSVERFRGKTTDIRIPNGMCKPLKDYEQYAKERCLLCWTSLGRHMYCIGVFMDFLGSRGRESLSQMQVGDISAFIKSRATWKPSTLAYMLGYLRRFFQFLFMRDILPRDFSHVLPRIRTVRQATIPSVWEKELVEKLLNTVDRGSLKGKRDYAILLLAARLGLRVSDIRGLTLDNLHWESATIEITQIKTGVPLVLPMSEEVGSALIDYLRAGRPAVAHRQVFLQLIPPFDPFSERNGLGSIMRFWRGKAKFKYQSKHRKGFHSLRHTLATRLLHAETPFYVISDVLGHTSPTSTLIYAKADTELLRIASINPDEVCHV